MTSFIVLEYYQCFGVFLKLTKKVQIQRIHNYYDCGCSISLKFNIHTRLEIEWSQ